MQDIFELDNVFLIVDPYQPHTSKQSQTGSDYSPTRVLSEISLADLLLGHPEIYLLLLYASIVMGSKNPDDMFSTLENQNELRMFPIREMLVIQCPHE